MASNLKDAILKEVVNPVAAARNKGQRGNEMKAAAMQRKLAKNPQPEQQMLNVPKVGGTSKDAILKRFAK